MEQVQESIPKLEGMDTDRFGRIIIERKVIVYFRDNEIQVRAWAKKLVDNKEIFQVLEDHLVPEGWSHRRDKDFFYQANTQNLINIFTYKQNNSFCGFADSFCIFANKKIKEAIEQNDAFDQIKDLSLSDEEKIKALPDLMPKAVPDFLHQKIASRYACLLPCAGLLEEQGLGKTKSAIEAYLFKKERNLVDRCLVIGPLSVINMKGWGDQIKAYAPKASFVFIRGNQERKQEILEGRDGYYDFYLINYEGTINVLNDLLSWVDDRTMVILDESLKIKNYYAARTKACLKIAPLTQHKMVLNGTPSTQGAWDVFSQMYFLDCGDTFGQSYDNFLKKYFNKDGYKLEPKRNAPEMISDAIMKKSIRFTKKEALPGLPDKTYQIREVTLSPKQIQYYNLILKEEIVRLSELERVDAQNILVTILRLQQITSGWIVAKDDNDVALPAREIEPNHNAKINALAELLDNLGDQPAVIWSRFRWDVFNIAKMLDRRGSKYVTFVGGMNEKQREESQRRFMEGEAQYFISIPSAGGFGMNLQRASYAIYYSNDYSLGNRLQSEDRIHRIGQKNACTIIDMVASSDGLAGTSIDMSVLDALQAKKDMADLVSGDWKKFLGG